jgi:hypothetical protein
VSRPAFRIILVLLSAILVMIALEWYSHERLRLDLERAEVQHQWALEEYEQAKRERE